MRFGWSRATQFRADARGSVALIFGLSVFVLFGVVGLAVDMSRAYNLSQKVGAAIDSAALSAAKLLGRSNSTDAQVRANAIAMLNAHLASLEIDGVSLGTPEIRIDRQNVSIEIDVPIIMKTTFAQVIGYDRVAFTKSTEVQYEVQRLELAMVLDVTGSMNDQGRLPALKAAATDVIDTLIDQQESDLVRISLVPYSAAVNVGPAYQHIASGGDSLDGCVMERLYAATRDTDEPPGGSRNFAVNGQLNSNVNTRYECPNARLLPLTNDAELLRDTINSYEARGWTAGHIGLAWGWNTISEKWRHIFTGDHRPNQPGPRNIKAILFMTDGQFNTAYTAGASDAEQIAESEARTNALCNAIKARGIRIYTVSFMAPASADALLQGCSTAGNHYTANSAPELLAAFRSIAQSMLNLRLKS